VALVISVLDDITVHDYIALRGVIASHSLIT